MRADGLSQQTKSQPLVPRRIDSIMHVRDVSCISLTPEAQKKIEDRRAILCWQLAEVCRATCWPSAERGSPTGGAWGVSLRSGPCVTPGGDLMRPKAETRHVLRRAESSARGRKVPSVWYVPGDQQEEPMP